MAGAGRRPAFNRAPPKGSWAQAKAVWQERMLELPERARPIFAEPPSSRIEELQDYLELAAVRRLLDLGRIEQMEKSCEALATGWLYPKIYWLHGC